MKTTLDASALQNVVHELAAANAALRTAYPGDSGARQPVHVVYGGAHLFKSVTAERLGMLARKSLTEYAPNGAALASAVGMKSNLLADEVYERTMAKLQREPVEDFRIDFEDGYGNRPDAEEDGHASAAALEVAKAMDAKSLPPFIGIRVKPLSEELHRRSLRTLDLFLTTLLDATGGKLPDRFFITLPKISHPAQPAALAKALDRFEERSRLPAKTLRFEIMIETTQAVFDANGRLALPLLLEASAGRCVAAHFGTYDYTASCGITAAHQDMLHPACDLARSLMQVAFGSTGVWLSDGGTNVLPVPVHSGDALTETQKSENRAAVHKAWKLHFDHIQHSLRNGFYEGWDLHPAQLPTRYAAVYSFYLGSLPVMAARLSHFIQMAARATTAGNVFDDAATGQGLLNFFLRALNCGAVDEAEAGRLTSLTPEELRSGSFLKILQGRSR